MIDKLIAFVDWLRDWSARRKSAAALKQFSSGYGWAASQWHDPKWANKNVEPGIDQFYYARGLLQGQIDIDPTAPYSIGIQRFLLERGNEGKPIQPGTSV